MAWALSLPGLESYFPDGCRAQTGLRWRYLREDYSLAKADLPDRAVIRASGYEIALSPVRAFQGSRCHIDIRDLPGTKGGGAHVSSIFGMLLEGMAKESRNPYFALLRHVAFASERRGEGIRATAAVRIGAPAADVFDYIANPDRLSDWREEINPGDALTISPDWPAVGARIRRLDRQIPWLSWISRLEREEYEVAHFRRPVEIHYRQHEWLTQGETRLRLMESGDATLLEVEAEVQPKGRIGRFVTGIVLPTKAAFTAREAARIAAHFHAAGRVIGSAPDPADG